MKNGIQPGKVLDFVAAADRVGGQGYIEGDLFHVATETVLSGETYAGLTEEVVNMDVNAADTPVVGERAWWDDSAKEWRTASAVGRFQAATFTSLKDSGNKVNVKLKGFALAAD